MSGDAKRGGVVVLGSTSAMAGAIARAFAQRGHPIIVAARDGVENETLADDLRVRYQIESKAIAWDATDHETHEEFVGQCVEHFGDNFEGIVLCSGFMDDQKAAQDNWAIAQQTIDVNFSGSVSVINRFANHLESKGAGWIAVVGSVAGDRGRQSNYIYGAAKAGLAIYLEGLRNRLFHASVHVMTIKPGFVDTKMTFGQVPFAASPESVAKAVLKALDKRKNVVYVPFFWRYIMLLIRHIPEWQFKKMKM